MAKKTRKQYLESFRQGCDKYYRENGTFKIGMIENPQLTEARRKLEMEIGVSRVQILKVLAEIKAKYNPLEA